MSHTNQGHRSDRAPMCLKKVFLASCSVAHVRNPFETREKMSNASGSTHAEVFDFQGVLRVPITASSPYFFEK